MDDDNQSKKDKEFNKILQNGTIKDFINFFVSNYLNNITNESIIKIAIKNNNFNLVYSLLNNGFVLNNNDREIIKVIKNINNVNNYDEIKKTNNEILGFIHH